MFWLALCFSNSGLFSGLGKWIKGSALQWMNLFWFHSVLRLCTSKKGPSKRKYSSYRHLSKDMCCYFPLPSPSPSLFSACLFCGSVAGLPSQWLSQPPTWQASAWFQPAEGSQENGGWKKRGSECLSPLPSLCAAQSLAASLSPRPLFQGRSRVFPPALRGTHAPIVRLFPPRTGQS